MRKELKSLGEVLSAAEHPFIAILGGASLSRRIPVINALIDGGVDKILIGGAIAYTFLKAEGFTVGKSLVEDRMLQTALEIKKRAEERGILFLLPTDHQVVDSFEPIKGQQIITKTIPIEFTNIGLVGLDIGVETITHFAAALRDARMVVWDGPMGVIEEPPFDQGTISVARTIAEIAERGVRVLIVGDFCQDLPIPGMQKGSNIFLKE
jgi:phosphoglycerate kinase